MMVNECAPIAFFRAGLMPWSMDSLPLQTKRPNQILINIIYYVNRFSSSDRDLVSPSGGEYPSPKGEIGFSSDMFRVDLQWE